MRLLQVLAFVSAVVVPPLCAQGGGEKSSTTAWRSQLSPRGSSAVLVLDGKVMACRPNGTLAVICLETGRQQQVAKVGGDGRFLTAGRKFVYVASGATITALNHSDWSTGWTALLPGMASAKGVETAGKLYFPFAGAQPGVAVVDCESGKLLSTIETGGVLLTEPLVDGPNLYCALANGKMEVIAIRSGRVTGAIQTGGVFAGQVPTRAGERILLAPGGDHRRLNAVPLNLSAKGAWEIPFLRPVYAPQTLTAQMFALPPQEAQQLAKSAGGTLRKSTSAPLPGPSDYVPSGPVHTTRWSVWGTDAAVVVKEPGFAADALYQLIAVRHSNGSQIFKAEFYGSDRSAATLAAPVFSRDYIAAALEPGSVRLFDRNTGAVLMEETIGGSAEWVAIAGGRLLAKTSRDSLIAFLLPALKSFPAAYELWQNNPNPFRVSTQLRYGLPFAANVQLTIVTPAGRMVKSLAHGRKDAGYYTAVWDGRGESGMLVPAGLYLARFKAGSFAKTVSMTFVK